MKLLEEDLKEIGMEIGGENYRKMMDLMPKPNEFVIIDNDIKIKDISKLNIGPGEVLIIRIPVDVNVTPEMYERIGERIKKASSELFGNDVKIMICDDRYKFDVARKDSKRKRTYKKEKFKMGIWKA